MFKVNEVEKARDAKKEANLDKFKRKPGVPGNEGAIPKPETKEILTTAQKWSSTTEKNPELLKKWQEKPPVKAEETKPVEIIVREEIQKSSVNFKVTGKLRIDSSLKVDPLEEELRLKKLKELETTNEKEVVKSTGKFANSKLSDKNSLISKLKESTPIANDIPENVPVEIIKKAVEKVEEPKAEVKKEAMKNSKKTDNTKPEVAQEAMKNSKKIENIKPEVTQAVAATKPYIPKKWDE